MVPADANDIAKEYEILLNELTQYNPELLDKQRILAVSKSDMLDEELEEAVAKELPTDLPSIFISSLTHKGIIALKDLLWKELNKQVFHDTESIVYKPMNLQLEDVDDDFDFSPPGKEEDANDLDYDEIDWENS
jgi:GTP-binding protein